jgi:tetratricopeptide (TPR) repeat protein
MLRKTAGLIVIGAVCLQAPAAWSKTGPHFEVGVEMLKQFEYKRALEAFQKALEWPGNTSKEWALIQVYIGIAQSNLGDYTAAEKSFKEAQTIDPNVEPPKLTSPKIRAVFEKVKAESRATPTQRVPRRAPAPVKEPKPASTSPLGGDEEIDEEEDEQPSTVNWPAWLTLGAAVVAGGVGAAMGGLNLSEKSKAEDTKLPYNEAQDHADKASSYGVAANILMITAGAAAVTSGILFYLGYKRKKEQEGAQATIVPTGSGVMVQLELWR